jgi:hypothetical protein
MLTSGAHAARSCRQRRVDPDALSDEAEVIAVTVTGFEHPTSTRRASKIRTPTK